MTLRFQELCCLRVAKSSGQRDGSGPRRRGCWVDPVSRLVLEACVISDVTIPSDHSIDLPESEELDLATLHHSDSRSPLNSPQAGHDGMFCLTRTFLTASLCSVYPMPSYNVSGNLPYLTPPQAAATHSPSTSQRVQYPPTPYRSPKQDYTTVPLRDTSPVTQPDRGTPSPLPSGANTPNGSANRKKYWTFLPMHSSQSLDSGLGTVENEKRNKRPRSHRTGSWDLLGDKAEWEDYNVAEANVENLRFAEGDVGTTKVCDCLFKQMSRRF